MAQPDPRVSAPRPTRLWRAVPTRRGFGPLPLSTIVGLEALAIAGLWAWLLPTMPDLAFAGALAALGLLWAIPVGGYSLGGWLARRARFAMGRRVLSAPPEADPTVAHTRAVFPSLVATQVRPKRGGGSFGVVAWGGGTTAVMALGMPRGADPAAVAPLPLAQMWRRIAAAGIPMDALTVTAEHVPGGLGAPLLLGLRLRADDAADAIAARGGGDTGLRAALATAVALATSSLAAAGWTASALEADELQRALTHVLEPRAEGTEPGRTGGAWVGSWSGMTGPQLLHRFFVARRWPTSASPTQLLAGLPCRATVTLEVVRPPAAAELADAPDRVWLRVLVRLAAQGPSAIAQGAQALRSVPGLQVRPVTEDPVPALRAVTPLGVGTGPLDRAARSAAGPLNTWLAADLDGLDSIVR